ncbi:MAG: proteasome assembly chaperone family protein [Candidatus Methanogaster sp.]|uniref:Proteasome assembly chaperone family protein n=1 Tax=Candidatus Methanogaster sp. TaxID=3386292 RepID=A0AC61L6A7_9EURY|nr:MAG: proteasome assembly chaperone family protein [ANME-2 cluster archaeon]
MRILVYYVRVTCKRHCFDTFPGIGLVGNIASQQIIDEPGMEHPGAVNSKHFPPVAMLLEGRVNMPVRIYESMEKEMIVVVSDIPIHPTIAYIVSKSLVNWATSVNARQVVSIAGMPVVGANHIVFGAATTEEGLESIKEEVEIFQMGSISGIAGSIMTECFTRKLPAISLLGSTSDPNPNPIAAAAVLKVLNNLYNLSIDTEKLVKQAEQIELEMQKLAETVRETVEQEEPPKPLPMYG